MLRAAPRSSSARATGAGCAPAARRATRATRAAARRRQWPRRPRRPFARAAGTYRARAVAGGVRRGADRGVQSVSGTLTTSAASWRAASTPSSSSTRSSMWPSRHRPRTRPASLLADGGLLVVSRCPNFGSWQRCRFGADWFHLAHPPQPSVALHARAGLEAAPAPPGLQRRSQVGTSTEHRRPADEACSTGVGRRRSTAGSGRYLAGSRQPRGRSRPAALGTPSQARATSSLPWRRQEPDIMRASPALDPPRRRAAQPALGARSRRGDRGAFAKYLARLGHE